MEITPRDIAGRRVETSDGEPGTVIGWEPGHEGTWLYVAWDRDIDRAHRCSVSVASRWAWLPEDEDGG